MKIDANTIILAKAIAAKIGDGETPSDFYKALFLLVYLNRRK